MVDTALPGQSRAARAVYAVLPLIDAFHRAHPEILVEVRRVAARLVPIWQDWVDRNEKAKKPAREMYRTYLDVMKKAGEPVVVKLPAR